MKQVLAVFRDELRRIFALRCEIFLRTGLGQWRWLCRWNRNHMRPVGRLGRLLKLTKNWWCFSGLHARPVKREVPHYA